ncbi:MAG TPA: hypothetical protein VEH30_12620 [Terriglobales bacterium]|nr:hypothetical protein [Terriglobales bacterium]
MPYFYCLLAGSWMFALGWFLGAIYVQNQNDKTPTSIVGEQQVAYPDFETWRLGVGAAGAAD